MSDEMLDHDIDDGEHLDDEDDDYDTFDCAMDRRGQCGKAGSEECDWECPFNRRGLRTGLEAQS